MGKKRTSKTGTIEHRKVVDRIVNALLNLVSRVPSSTVKADQRPADAAKSLILHASAKAALVSGTLALPPGPLGLLTVLPDLMAIWNIQRQLVADIAAAHKKSSQLGPAAMIYCLFRHAAAQTVRDVVMRVGERFIVRRATGRLMQRAMRRVGISITERATGRAVSRWLPVIGAVGIGGYAFYDTVQVGRTAAAFFQKEIVQEEESGPEGESAS
jgi:hypothetical protein